MLQLLLLRLLTTANISNNHHHHTFTSTTTITTTNNISNNTTNNNFSKNKIHFVYYSCIDGMSTVQKLSHRGSSRCKKHHFHVQTGRVFDEKVIAASDKSVNLNETMFFCSNLSEKLKVVKAISRIIIKVFSERHFINSPPNIFFLPSSALKTVFLSFDQCSFFFPLLIDIQSLYCRSFFLPV